MSQRPVTFSLLMRSLLSKVASLGGVLLVAAAVAASAPGTRSLVAQSAFLSSQPAPISVPSPDPRWRVSTPPPALAPVATTAKPVAVALARPAAPPPPASRPHTTIGTGQWGLINQDRAANGLAPLQWSSCLAVIASQNAARMAAQGFISHANGVTLDLGCHLDPRAGENVGYLSNGINDGVMNTMFMNSPTHRANILGPYRYVGVAWVVAPNGAAYIAVEFS